MLSKKLTCGIKKLALKNLCSDSNQVTRIQDKGSRFVVLDKGNYVEKVSSNLQNQLYYREAPEDPTNLRLDGVKNWRDKWLAEGQFSREIADWVTERQPKLGVAFGNIKTYKANNPLRLITFCCGTAIEKLLPFTEFYLKALAQNLLSFLKDTTELINKINDLTSKGPLPRGTGGGLGGPWGAWG